MRTSIAGHHCRIRSRSKFGRIWLVHGALQCHLLILWQVCKSFSVLHRIELKKLNEFGRGVLVSDKDKYTSICSLITYLIAFPSESFSSPRICRLNREELWWLQVQGRNEWILILVLGKAASLWNLWVFQTLNISRAESTKIYIYHHSYMIIYASYIKLQYLSCFTSLDWSYVRRTVWLPY